MLLLTSSEVCVQLTHGLPDTIVTDNAAVFTSTEMKELFSHNGIKHTTSAPYHPASNGLDKRAIQTFKSANLKNTNRLTPTAVNNTSTLHQYRGTDCNFWNFEHYCMLL